MAIRKITSAPHPALAGPGSGANGQDAPAGGRELTISIDGTHRAVMAVLGSEEPDAEHMAIARLSAHLAAMRETVYPVARRQPGPARQVLVTYLDSARELDWALRLLHCSITGEAFASHLDPNALYARFGHYLGCYASAEGALVALLAARLPAGDRDRIAARYRKALAHAPTRPHPRRPHTGAAYHVRFRLHGVWDRLLDTADARPGTGHDFPQRAPRTRPAVIPPRRLLPGSRLPASTGGEPGGRIEPDDCQVRACKRWAGSLAGSGRSHRGMPAPFGSTPASRPKEDRGEMDENSLHRPSPAPSSSAVAPHPARGRWLRGRSHPPSAC